MTEQATKPRVRVPARRSANEPIDINPLALAMLGQAAPALTPIMDMPAFDQAALFRPYQPPPGVVPKDAMTTNMAMDDGAWAWGSTAYSAATSINWGNGIGFPGYAFLSELSQRPEYRRASEVIAKEMTRKWIHLKTSGTNATKKADRIAAMNAAMKRHKLRDVFRVATTLDGFFGVGHLYIDTGATDDPDTLKLPLPIAKATIKKGMLKGFRTVEPIWTTPNQYDASDPLNPRYYRPQTWFVNGKEVHASRLLQFISRPLPEILKPAYNFGGLSLSQLGMPYVNNWLRTRQSVSDITHSFSVPVLSTALGDLTQLGAAQVLINRVMAFNRFRDNRGAFVIDKEKEEFQIANATLASLDKLQAQAQEQMAAIWGIPLVIYWGITPSGLNPSADGEIRTFYAWIHAQQEQLYTEPLQRCLEIIQLDEFGDIDDEIEWEFVSLWELDDAAKAVVQKTKADTHAVYSEVGAVGPEEIRLSVASDPDSPYAGLDIGDTPPPDPPETDLNEPINGDPAKSLGETRSEERSGV